MHGILRHPRARVRHQKHASDGGFYLRFEFFVAFSTNNLGIEDMIFFDQDVF